MGRRQVIEIVCDRCGRQEIQTDKDLGKARKNLDSPDPEFSMNHLGRVVVFRDLCNSCRRALTNLVDKVTRAKREDPAHPSQEPRPGPDGAPKPKKNS